MNQLIAFTKKEFLSTGRSAKGYIILGIFVLFGVLNPLFAKLTPALLQVVDESLGENGTLGVEITANAEMSWSQYYGNISTLMIALFIMISNTFTNEYSKGTLINMITKGMDRSKIVIAKFINMFTLWTVCYWIQYAITYIITGIWWGNGTVPHLFFAAFCYYLMGTWMVTLITLFSSFLKSMGMVMLTTGATFLVVCLSNFFPKVEKFTPLQLTNYYDIFEGCKLPDFTYAIIITALLIVLNIMLSIRLFNKRGL